MITIKESNLFIPVKNLLLERGCSEVYGEVLRCDVLGINGAANIVVELKTTLSFKLIDQAIERLDYGHYVFIAIPERKSTIPRCVTKLLEMNKIGLLEIKESKLFNNELVANVLIPARYNHLPTNRKKKGLNSIRKYIKSYNQTQVGGVKSGDSPTDYSIMVENIKDFLHYRKRGNWATVDEILEHCETKYTNPKPSLMATLQAEWNRSWLETKKDNRKRYFRLKNERG